MALCIFTTTIISLKNIRGLQHWDKIDIVCKMSLNNTHQQQNYKQESL